MLMHVDVNAPKSEFGILPTTIQMLFWCVVVLHFFSAQTYPRLNILVLHMDVVLMHLLF